MKKVISPVGYASLGVAVLFLSFCILISCSPKKDPASPAPSITSIAPDNGQPGDAVTINGTNFSTDKTKDIVKFGTTPATVSAATATVLTVQAPLTLTTGVVKITVTTDNGTSNEATFTVPALNPPQILSVDKDSVSKGQTLTITGTNLNRVDSVTINGVKQTISSKSATSIALTNYAQNLCRPINSIPEKYAYHL